MMQRCTGNLVFKIFRVPIIGQFRSRTNVSKNKASKQEEENHDLICTKWEEAIIKEHRMPDNSFDVMQKNTIDQVHENNSKDTQYNKQQQSNQNSNRRPPE